MKFIESLIVIIIINDTFNLRYDSQRWNFKKNQNTRRQRERHHTPTTATIFSTD